MANMARLRGRVAFASAVLRCIATREYRASLTANGNLGLPTIKGVFEDDGQPDVYQTLNVFHRQHPELRLGQIVENAMYFVSCADVFYLKDTTLLIGIKRLAVAHKVERTS